MSISTYTGENKPAWSHRATDGFEWRPMRRRPGPQTAQGLRHEQRSAWSMWATHRTDGAWINNGRTLGARSTPPAEDVGTEAQRSPGPEARGDRSRRDEAPAVRERAHVSQTGWNTNQRDESPPPERRQGGDRRPSSERHGLEAER